MAVCMAPHLRGSHAGESGDEGEGSEDRGRRRRKRKRRRRRRVLRHPWVLSEQEVPPVTQECWERTGSPPCPACPNQLTV